MPGIDIALDNSALHGIQDQAFLPVEHDYARLESPVLPKMSEQEIKNNLEALRWVLHDVEFGVPVGKINETFAQRVMTLVATVQRRGLMHTNIDRIQSLAPAISLGIYRERTQGDSLAYLCRLLTVNDKPVHDIDDEIASDVSQNMIRLRSMGASIFFENAEFISHIIYDISHPQNEHALKSFEHYLRFISSGFSNQIPEQWITQGVGILRSNLNKVENVVHAYMSGFSQLLPEELVRYATLLRLTLQFADDESAERAAQVLSELIRFQHPSTVHQRIIIEETDGLSRALNPDVAINRLIIGNLELPWPRDRAMLFFKHLLHGYGLSESQVLYAWEIGSRKGDNLRTVRRNIHAMNQLEQQKPGICKVLNREFGIAHFDRYPLDVLIDQYTNRNNTDLPYGIVASSHYDWNGGFYADRSISDLIQFHKQLTGMGYGLRITEFGSKLAFAQQLIKLDRRYGAFQKIRFALLTMHGDTDNIAFHESSSMGLLNIYELISDVFPRLANFFSERPTIILNSCWVGGTGDFSQLLSERLGPNVRVLSPATQVDEISTITARVETDGELSFQVEFRDDNKTAKHTLFVGGQKAA